MSSKTLRVVLLIGGVIVLFTIVMTVLGLDFFRWINCSSPFTPLQDKNSDVCRRFQSAP